MRIALQVRRPPAPVARPYCHRISSPPICFY